MNGRIVTRFMPSLQAPETLERHFVQRTKLAETLASGIRESALTENKHYYLVTGPGGIGKTHLVSLVYHRLLRDRALEGRLKIAWLREEEWGVASYLDLLLVVLRALPEVRGDPVLSQDYRRLKEPTAPDQARAAAEALLLRTVGSSTLLIIAENLEGIFDGLGTEGQQALRALIQNHPSFALLATTQTLFPGVSERTQPFYGFFDVHQLGDLTFDHVVLLVTRVAAHSRSTDLAELLGSPRGRARLRAVYHLAGGNPRVYVTFSRFVDAENFDGLVQPLLETLDDLTPCYQTRIVTLSPQQRKLIEYLCERRGAVTVGEIAQANFITSQTTSSQLRKLDQLGYVRSTQRGRTSHYEIRDPLLRLVLEAKEHHTGSVRQSIEFLRDWYAATELDVADGSEAVSSLPNAAALASEAMDRLLEQRLTEGRAGLDRALGDLRAAGADPGEAGVTDDLLRRANSDADVCRVVPVLLEVFEKHGALGPLGVGLVRSIRTLARGPVGTSASRWLGAWTEAGGTKDALRIPIRILGAAVASLSEGSETAELALAPEEREVLSGLLHASGASGAHEDRTGRGLQE